MKIKNKKKQQQYSAMNHNQNKLNTTIDFPLSDGSTVQLTLTFYALYKLKSKNPDLYKRYNAAMQKIGKDNYDELSMITILYTAYRCNDSNEENPMDEETFISLCGSDRVATSRAIEKLMKPKN